MFSFQGASLNLQETQWNIKSLCCFSQSLWWRVPGSNRWPPACKAGALPAELTPQKFQLKVKSWKLTVHNFQLSIFNFQLLRSGGPGLAFLRESHAGCNSPPDCCQEPAFESILACVLVVLSRPGLNPSFSFFKKWWAKMDSNHRPHDYQSCALASWAIGPYSAFHIFC